MRDVPCLMSDTRSRAVRGGLAMTRRSMRAARQGPGCSLENNEMRH